MNYLFIHQNFPGQYLRIAQHLRSIKGNTVIGVGEAVNIQGRGTISGMTTIGYPSPKEAADDTHHYLKPTEVEIRRGQSVVRVLLNLKQQGFVPDVISVHPGWGEGLFVRDVFPETPIVMFCEFFFTAGQADLQFDSEFPYSFDWSFAVRIRNASQLISLPTANLCLCPTTWQASRYPWFIREKIKISHEGIDTEFMTPGDDKLTLQALNEHGDCCVLEPFSTLEEGTPTIGDPFTLTKKDKIISYIARNLEPYRGIHSFLRALPDVQNLHPDAHIIIIGGDGVSYSPVLPDKMTYKEKYLAELEGKLNLSKVHFLGKVPYGVLRSVFRISSAHVYLTYPFVLSWSMLEAMACECLVVGSSTEPVREVLEDGINGLLVDFFSREELVGVLDQALSKNQQFASIRKAARQTILDRFELTECLRGHTQLLFEAASGKYPIP